jgi:hypothetical protein
MVGFVTECVPAMANKKKTLQRNTKSERIQRTDFSLQLPVHKMRAKSVKMSNAMAL